MSSIPSPREAALHAAEAVSAAPTGRVAYSSRGRVAVVGDAAAVAGFCRGLPETLQAMPVITVPSRLPRGRLHLEGHLGDFQISLDNGPEAATLLAEADLVVDLAGEGETPLRDLAMPPFGYYRAAGEADWAGLWADTEQMVGQFQKPRFFNYDPDICAHGRSGLTACNRCVAACPAQAITALAEQVSVDPYLCQGGGVCATVCPTGAMTYAYPDTATTLERLRVLIGTYRARADGEAPVVLFCDQAGAARLAGRLPGNWLPLPQEELASVGIEVWLSALAYGAAAVVLVEPEALSSPVRTALFGQSQIANLLLAAMGYPEAVVHWDDGELPRLAALPERQVAAFAGQGGKRQVLFMALDQLHATAPVQPQVTLLPAHAPLGRIQVNAERCTLCMACASVCPAKALSAGTESPRLDFHEVNCVQCGLCQQACPESAISLEPRLLHDAAARRAVSVLMEEPPFCCVSCGKPFATRKAIEVMLDKLSGHWMYADEQARERLKMCGDCRVIDMMKDSA